ncbi:hypothetical protein AVEN_260089-1 [Araneus ventricosus]|uniref:Uncharacterized protein n=1 Tax=Araneus ventricosus TaxID=182803 RepID=A0A4Y2G3L2_ARAVE|nr:hypothetical protein AVEN_260089-1 [Araneus ventricosus]
MEGIKELPKSDHAAPLHILEKGDVDGKVQTSLPSGSTAYIDLSASLGNFHSKSPVNNDLQWSTTASIHLPNLQVSNDPTDDEFCQDLVNDTDNSPETDLASFNKAGGPHQDASEPWSDDEDDTWTDTFLSELQHHINDRTFDHRFVR